MPRPGDQPQVNKVTDHPFTPPSLAHWFDKCSICRLDEQSHEETLVIRNDGGVVIGITGSSVRSDTP